MSQVLPLVLCKTQIYSLYSKTQNMIFYKLFFLSQVFLMEIQFNLNKGPI